MLEGSGELLVASWALFGRILDALGRLLGASWASFVHLGPSRLDMGSILEGFGQDLGGSWEDFGQFLDGFWTHKFSIHFCNFVCFFEPLIHKSGLALSLGKYVPYITNYNFQIV